ncbi:hypothetical protein BH10BAC5_BH10BAC5_27720 [soil metagenome]
MGQNSRLLYYRIVEKMITAYKYLGDKMTEQALKGMICFAIRNKAGKCIRGKNGNMLVSSNGMKYVVIARLLRKL